MTDYVSVLIKLGVKGEMFMWRSSKTLFLYNFIIKKPFLVEESRLIFDI